MAVGFGDAERSQHPIKKKKEITFVSKIELNFLAEREGVDGAAVCWKNVTSLLSLVLYWG